jgi:hypothetical protein
MYLDEAGIMKIVAITHDTMVRHSSQRRQIHAGTAEQHFSK